MKGQATKRTLGWLRRHWLLWGIPLVGVGLWCFYLWDLARADVAAPDLPFIYDL